VVRYSLPVGARRGGGGGGEVGMAVEVWMCMKARSLFVYPARWVMLFVNVLIEQTVTINICVIKTHIDW